MGTRAPATQESGAAAVPESAPMTPPTPLLVFAGSTRAQSHNRKLAQVAADAGRAAGAQVTHLELADFDLPLYNADLETRGTPDNARRLKEIFHAHPAWVICSPEYNGSYTGLLKNTLDWVSSPIKGDPEWSSGTKPFAGKVVGLLSASPGALGGLRSLSHLSPLLLNLQCWLTPKQYALSKAAEAFDDKGQLISGLAQAAVQGVVEQALHGARKLHAPD